MFHKKTGGENGFTIVELLVALIVGAIFTGVASLVIVQQAYISQLGRDIVLANSYVETKVEAIRSASYNSLSNGSEDITDELPIELNTPRSGTVQISDGPATGTKEIQIVVTYNQQGQQKTFSYSTLIGELGVGQ